MTTHAIPRIPLRFAPFRAVFEGIGATFSSFANARAAAGEVEFLLGLSDAALARRGLSRDRVVHHAFRSYLAD